eukprot:CAMPEP_0119410262 /NCGR_PEP_ID=MMETSP1335-20130426/3336_1 /TAXON_ID=259385 /ORGANISM="Chrysoculter rhomboideus, Strain RCC1486" /LENGTH=103 /DNA_ID=CAMNT_0007434759 /DNA_START=46 /DNA_END=358 /DNA_ORIENTATION=+
MTVLPVGSLADNMIDLTCASRTEPRTLAVTAAVTGLSGLERRRRGESRKPVTSSPLPESCVILDDELALLVFLVLLKGLHVLPAEAAAASSAVRVSHSVQTCH